MCVIWKFRHGFWIYKQSGEDLRPRAMVKSGIKIFARIRPTKKQTGVSLLHRVIHSSSSGDLNATFALAIVVWVGWNWRRSSYHYHPRTSLWGQWIHQQQERKLLVQVSSPSIEDVVYIYIRSQSAWAALPNYIRYLCYCAHRFNQVFDQSTKQEEIFENVAHGVIDKYIICLCFSFVTYGSFLN